MKMWMFFKKNKKYEKEYNELESIKNYLKMKIKEIEREQKIIDDHVKSLMNIERGPFYEDHTLFYLTPSRKE